MTSGKIENIQVSPEERAALELFFKNFNLAFRSATMYFKEHPSFIRSISQLKEGLDKVSVFRTSLNMGITQDDVLLEGKYINKGQLPYRELGPYLHQRKIKTLKVSTAISSEALRDFIARLATSLRDIQTGTSLQKIIGGIRGIDAEELDYSPLLATKGETAANIWNILFSKETLLSEDSLQYISDNIEEAAAAVEGMSYEDESAKTVFENFEKIARSLDAKDQEKAKKFLEGGFNALCKMPRDALETFSSRGQAGELKDLFSKYLDDDSVFRNLIKQVVHAKKCNRLFLNVYNSIFKDNKSAEGLAEQVSSFLRAEDSAKEKKRISESLKELLLKDPSDEFVSSLYKKTLFYLTEAPPMQEEDRRIIEEYAKDLEDERIREDYLCIIMELLEAEDKPEDVKALVSRVEEAFPLLFEEKNIPLIRQLVELLEEKKERVQDNSAKASLSNLYRSVCSARLLELILQNITTFQDQQDILFIIRRIDGAAGRIVAELLRVTSLQVHKSLKDLLEAIADLGVVEHLKEILRTESGTFMVREAVDILSRLRTRESMEALTMACQIHQKNPALVLEMLKAMRFNPFKDKGFLGTFSADKDYAIRREAATSFLEIAEPEERKQFVKAFLSVGGFMGSRNALLMENIGILEAEGDKEAVPHLKQFVLKRPLFFTDRRDELRVRSLEALLSVDPLAVASLEGFITRDPNRKIRELAFKFKESRQG